MEAKSPEPARRASILEAAHSCFWRNGIRRTSIDDIARAANVAKGTVYLYFDSKEELFASLASEMCDEVLRGVHAALEAPVPLSRRLSLPSTKRSATSIACSRARPTRRS
jgi:AcrR family transcriptional regulator